MVALKELFTTDVGLLSLAVIVIVIGIAGYLLRHLLKLMKEKPGTEGWK
ncbi:MAG: DUF3149 domain-containing protein [Burkholderiales bacterium]|nr:DUF3149 domain-containing protein [Burkholderiales bacterium]